jgi:uncharacterized ferritin-like protein (DUF455 family)
MSGIGYYDVEGVRLREEPARDSRFRVVRRDSELEEQDVATDAGRRETIHRHMSNEITSLDIAAQCLVDFPDAPWGLRMELARQAWDESRHVAVLERRLREMGGHPGEFPISAFEWCVTSAIDNLPGRLATQNRTFEAGAMDVVGEHVREWRRIGDERTAEVLDAILADEIQHVRFANRWIKALAAADRRVLLKVAMAVDFLTRANRALAPAENARNAVGRELGSFAERIPAVNTVDRELADFSEEEIHEILKQAGFRTLVSTDPQGKPS